MASATLARKSLTEFAMDVRLGLTKAGQKEIPSKYLYDEVGSALFEVITVLPEYGLFRADERLLRENAESIAAFSPADRIVVAELGSGSGRKSSLMLEALAKNQPTVYRPIEISKKALDECSKQMERLNNVEIKPLQQTYIDGLVSVATERRAGERLLVLFLGSTIGNFESFAAAKFLLEIRRLLSPRDALLLSTDLEKPVSQLLAAYDDPLGVTAAFDLNLLARMNRELEADFDLCSFRHTARYDAANRRVEMHLVSTQRQCVTIPRAACEVSFSEGETIWTESSHKYQPTAVKEMGRRAGFRPLRQWLDYEWPFAQTLLVAA
jgi:dimethylhistidine N-methyltransferase